MWIELWSSFLSSADAFQNEFTQQILDLLFKVGFQSIPELNEQRIFNNPSFASKLNNLMLYQYFKLTHYHS